MAARKKFNAGFDVETEENRKNPEARRSSGLLQLDAPAPGVFGTRLLCPRSAKRP
jgi:hypothetical protein